MRNYYDVLQVRTGYQFNELGEPSFCSYGEDCSFFKGKLSWLTWYDLEDNLFKLDKNRFNKFRKDCRKIIKTAKILTADCSY